MKATRLAYLAGLFDGEGCISINRGRNGRGRPQYSLRAVVVNTERYVLNLFQFAFGGRIYKRKEYQGCRDCYAWFIDDRRAYDFLKAIYDYLVIKKSQADLAFEFQDSKRLGNNKLSDEEKAVREAQFIMMKQLKK